MWSAASSLPPDNDITHTLPLRLRDLSGPHPVALAPPVDEVGDHLALGADDARAGLLGDLQHPLTRPLAVLRVGLLGQRRLIANGHRKLFGQWLDRLVAANATGGVQVARPERQQQTGQGFGLRPAVFVQRPVAVVALVPALATRRAVPDDQHRAGVGRLSGEPAQHLPVVGIGQRVHHVVGRKPEQFVDLVVGREIALTGAGRPVHDLLDRLLHRVTDRHQPPTELCVKSGLLEDLPHRGDRLGLPGVDLALGQRPVVVARTVDDRDLRSVRPVGPGTPQHRTRSQNLHGRVSCHLNSCMSIPARSAEGEVHTTRNSPVTCDAPPRGLVPRPRIVAVTTDGDAPPRGLVPRPRIVAVTGGGASPSWTPGDRAPSGPRAGAPSSCRLRPAPSSASRDPLPR